MLSCILAWTMTYLICEGSRLHNGKICYAQSQRLVCRHLLATELDYEGFPRDSCMHEACGPSVCAVTTWKDFFLIADSKVVEKSTIFTEITPSNENEKLAHYYECQDEHHKNCQCGVEPHWQCNGDTQYCTRQQCTNTSSCECAVRPGKEKWRTLVRDELISNFKILSIKFCILHVETPQIGRKLAGIIPGEEKLMELNSDILFQKDNVSVRFITPIFHFKTSGSLILRMEGQEQIFPIYEKKLSVEVPMLFLQPGKELNFIFIARDGQVVRGNLLANSELLCRRAPELMSLEALNNIRCLPKSVQYILACSCLLLTGLTLIYMRNMVILLFSTIQGLYFIMRQAIRIIRGSSRMALVGGHLTGAAINRAKQRIREKLANLEANLGRMHMAIAILAICCILTEVQSREITCNSNEIFPSDLLTCKVQENIETCQLITNAQLYLKNLQYTTCLFFKSKDKTAVALKITLQKVVCSYATHREYYTFPVKLHSSLEVICSHNEFCGWGTHCKSNVWRPGLQTPEATEYSGMNKCSQRAFSTGCILLHTNCHFFRYFFRPEYARAYEIRRIVSQSCSHQIRVVEESKNTSETILIRNLGTTRSGIAIHVLGALQSANLAFAEKCLAVDVRDSTKAFLVPCSHSGLPIKGSVGFIQANSSYSKNFLFDPAAVSCEHGESEVMCDLQESITDHLHLRKDLILPRAMALHLFTMSDANTLISEALSAAPVLVTLKFRDYEVSSVISEVCPQFTSEKFQYQGCFRCDRFASMTVRAMSTCGAGQVSVHCDSLILATPVVNLENVEKEITILFKSEIKCLSDELCFSSPQSSHCLKIKFCLQPAELILRNLNDTTATAGFRGASMWKSLFTDMFSFKGMTSALMWLIGLTMAAIFCFSTIISCLRR